MSCGLTSTPQLGQEVPAGVREPQGPSVQGPCPGSSPWENILQRWAPCLSREPGRAQGN